MKLITLLLLIFTMCSSSIAGGQKDSLRANIPIIGSKIFKTRWMTLDKMETIINKHAAILEGSTKGVWQLNFNNLFLYIVTDLNFNRMRIMSPIIEEDKIEDKHYKEILKAQHHTALDVKYSIANGYLWSVFIHPLKELTDEQFEDALKQVYFAALTFGTTYTSTDVQFGGGDKDEEVEEDEYREE